MDQIGTKKNKKIIKLNKMAKNTTKRIKQLKGEKPSKITNEELNNMQKSISDINRTQLEIGSLETKKYNLIYHATMLQEKLNSMQHDFKKAYGTSNINIQDGTIDYEDNE
tara:strand:- start:709 stop:1038 length:330 start_codon:yes stop_codon:yes gene_type:complete